MTYIRYYFFLILLVQNLGGIAPVKGADCRRPMQSIAEGMVAYVSPLDRQIILAGVAKEQLESVVSAIIRGTLDQVSLKDEVLDQAIFEAFRTGRISTEQMTSAFLWHGAAAELRLRNISLTKHRLFSDSFTLRLTDESQQYLKRVLLPLTTDQKWVYLFRLRLRPSSEQVYWVAEIPSSLLEPKANQAQEKLPWALGYHALLNTGHHFIPDKPEGASTVTLVVPTMSLMQDFILARFGKQGVQIRPILGISTEEGMDASARSNERDLGLFFVGTDTRIIAHGSDLGPIMAPLHDFHHAFTVSLVPWAHRKAFWRITEILRDLGGPKNHENLSTLYDMEFVLYQFMSTPWFGGSSGEEIFARTLLSVFRRDRSEIPVDQRPAIEVIIAEIRKNASIWKTQYRLDSKKLIELLSRY